MAKAKTGNLGRGSSTLHSRIGGRAGGYGNSRIGVGTGRVNRSGGRLPTLPRFEVHFNAGLPDVPKMAGDAFRTITAPLIQYSGDQIKKATRRR